MRLPRIVLQGSPNFGGVNSTARSIGPFGAASYSLQVKASNESCALCMSVNRADLAVFGVRGVEITMPTKFQVVKKTAQRFFRLAQLGHQFHGLPLLLRCH